MNFNIMLIIGGAIFLLALGISVGIYIVRLLEKSKVSDAKDTAKKILDDAKREAETVRKEAYLQAKDHLLKATEEFEKESRERRAELHNLEKRLVQKEEHLDKKVELFDRKESDLSRREKAIVEQERLISEKEKKYNSLLEETRLRLEKTAGMNAQEAKRQLMEIMESEAKHEAAKALKKIEDETRETAEQKSKEILALAIQRYAGEYVADGATSTVNLPNDEMKGRIIGREGRNIRAIEAATGVELIIDDTPEAVVISSHNPVRREIARIALERLIVDGRIHPGRVEEMVEKATQEVESAIKEAGERATFDVGVHGIHPELIKLLGRLKYRTSYSQNVYQHSMEVAFICGIIASELNLNTKQARRAGLLHDIGKAVDHEVEGAHAVIGADLAKKYGEAPLIIQAIGAHHDTTPDNLLGILVQAADALSAARPGARKEMWESYIQRLEQLEKIAKSFNGVERCYAIQAGRELRIIVEQNKISDENAVVLSKDIARRIEREVSYPGEIKVTVVRETRAVEYAR